MEENSILVPQVGDVLFFSPDLNDNFDRLIIAAQAAAGYGSQEFCHVELVISPRYTVGAVTPTVRIGNISSINPTAIARPAYTIPDGAGLAADYAISQVGKPYNIPGVVLLGLNTFIPAWKRVLASGANLVAQQFAFCSQLVAGAMTQGGYTPYELAAMTSPAMLAQVLNPVPFTQP
jgi:hypothetical protein